MDQRLAIGDWRWALSPGEASAPAVAVLRLLWAAQELPIVSLQSPVASRQSLFS
jgi:hypothetical protein